MRTGSSIAAQTGMILVMLIGFGCIPGIGNLRWQIRDQVTRAKRLFTLCQGIESAPSGTGHAYSFFGDDPQAVERIRATLVGGAAGSRVDPFTQITDHLDRIAELGVTLAQPPTVPRKQRAAMPAGEIVTAAKNLKQLLATNSSNTPQATWSDAATLLDEFLNNASNSNVLCKLNDCAEKAFRGPTQTGCAQSEVKDIVNQATQSAKFPATIENMRRGIVTILEETQRLDAVIDATSRDPSTAEHLAEVTQLGKFALREMLALGGMFRDAEYALRRLEAIRNGAANDAAHTEELARLFLAAEGDLLLDVSLLWLTNLIKKIDASIATLDERSYGAAAAVVDLALEAEAVDSAVCAAGGEIADVLIELGLRPGSLANRVCRSALGKPSDFPSSPLLARIYEGMIRASTSLPCADELHAKLAKQIEAPRSEECATPKSTPTQSKQAEPAIAWAVWDARIQAADGALVRKSTLRPFTEQDMPRLLDIPRGLTASLLLVEQREHTLLSQLQARPMDRFLTVQSALMQLSFAYRPDVYVPVCGEQGRAGDPAVAHRVFSQPAECSRPPADGGRPPVAPDGNAGVAEAIRQVAWEMCGINRKIDLRAQADALCAAVRDDARSNANGHLDCTVAGYDALILPPDDQYRSEEFPVPKPLYLGASPEISNSHRMRLEMIAGRLRELDARGLLPKRRRIRVSGAASDRWKDDAGPWILKTIAASLGYPAPSTNAVTLACRPAILPTHSLNVPASDFSNFLECNSKDNGTQWWCKETGTGICSIHMAKSGEDSSSAPETKMHSYNAMKEVFQRALKATHLHFEPLLTNKPNAATLPPKWMLQVVEGYSNQRFGSTSTPTNADERKIWRGEAANAILSILRAYGAAEIMDEAAPDLCQTSGTIDWNKSCVVEAIGATLSPVEDLSRRAVSITIQNLGNETECKGLISPAAIRVGSGP
ncbi:hypothetical protein [Sorangium sp. So ce381]|uniref:hypothetical protein n=1 Tax=Sorangium sp. So ce381 TaxID=3133307 RepID=UPI003F5CB8A4